MCWREKQDLSQSHICSIVEKNTVFLFRFFLLLFLFARFSCALQMLTYLWTHYLTLPAEMILSFYFVSGWLHTHWWQRPVLGANSAGAQVSEWPRDTRGRPQHPGSRSGSHAKRTRLVKPSHKKHSHFLDYPGFLDCLEKIFCCHNLVQKKTKRHWFKWYRWCLKCMYLWWYIL